MSSRWWWNILNGVPTLREMSTQSLTHCKGVASYPAYIAGFWRIPRADITPEKRKTNNYGMSISYAGVNMVSSLANSVRH